MRISPKREISLLIVLLLILTSLSAFSIIYSLIRIRVGVRNLKEEQLYLIEPIIKSIAEGKKVDLPMVFGRIVLNGFDSNPEFSGGNHIKSLITLSDGRVVKVDAYYQDATSKIFTFAIFSLILIIAAAATASGILYFQLYRTMRVVEDRTRKEISIHTAVSDALDRIRAKEREIELLASVVAHEVRNSLGSIIATIDDPAVKSEVDHINSFIKRLIEYTRIKEAKKEMVDLSVLVEDTIAEIEIPKGIKVRRDLEQVDHNLDPLLFSSVIKNLVINAVEACGKKGTIDISVRKNRSALVVELTDSGADIPSPIADHIFEPFFSTKEGGYGLGLAIVRRIVELHGGEIRLSKPGTKKTFTITIP